MRLSSIGCFVTGTPVHTKNGLVPIEKIKAGDLVLSRPGSKGELAYKQVLRIFSFDEKPIHLVGFYIVDSNLPEGGRIDYVAATADQPFWVKNAGWTRASDLYQGREIDLRDGTSGSILCAEALFRTEMPDVAWAERLHGAQANDHSGNLVSFERNSIRVDTGSQAPPESLLPSDDGTFPESCFFKRRVYNSEVAETRTYYVGDLGVWVRNE